MAGKEGVDFEYAFQEKEEPKEADQKENSGLVTPTRSRYYVSKNR